MCVEYYKFKNTETGKIHGFAPTYHDGIWKSLCGLRMEPRDKKWQPTHEKCNCINCMDEFRGHRKHESY